MVGNRLVELELHPAQPVGNIHIVDALDEDCPGVRVVVGDAWRFGVRLLVEGTRGGAVDKGPEYLDAFDALPCGWRHGEAGCGCEDEGKDFLLNCSGNDSALTAGQVFQPPFF